ncbi:protein of unknown function [Chitinophaga costaii]|uniref:DUF4843 domain-containing protein n=1 Tax=Chitinophaga costaii TaxID=1335309 RepID=A0A1C4FKN4_9BACT|nr:DUF4843 domain-containing protein [Chitinophaga costaii]PUZ29982.1 DUF4843 domain-containing protein [Chitinophaga costaii]SCC56558.1 protein of unknown function [Chitinophaga costaii]
MKRLYILYLLPLLLACNKEKMPPPSYEPGVFFYSTFTNQIAGGTDSTAIANVFTGQYSFYFSPQKTQDTFWFPIVRVMGAASDHDRTIDLEVTGGDGIAGTHYQLLPYIMPADSLTATLGIVLFKNALTDSTLHITLQFKPNADFPATALDSVLSGQYYYSNTFHLEATTKPIQPSYWSNVAIYMGKWSMVKYDFITTTLGKYLGVTDNPDDITNGYTDYLKVSNALTQYNLAHPGNPLRDENGKTVNLN